MLNYDVEIKESKYRMENFDELVSVIVPVYNVEKYLFECVKSIEQQSYGKLEIILVDDGSTDRSGLICNQMQQLDDRIIVIHKVNGGLSSARNVGISTAKGSYITCVDSDDVISSEYVEQLCRAMKKKEADVSVCRLKMLLDGNKVNFESCDYKTNVIEYSSEEALKEMLIQSKFDVSACGKLYKRELFHNIFYPDGKLFEDLATTYKIIDKANKIAFIDLELYMYRKRVDSITTSQYREENLSIFEAYSGFEELVRNKYPRLIKYSNYRKAEIASIILTKIDSSAINYKEVTKTMKRIIKQNLSSVLKNGDLLFKKKIKIIMALVSSKLLKIANVYNQKHLLNKHF